MYQLTQLKKKLQLTIFHSNNHKLAIRETWLYHMAIFMLGKCGIPKDANTFSAHSKFMTLFSSLIFQFCTKWI